MAPNNRVRLSSTKSVRHAILFSASRSRVTSVIVRSRQRGFATESLEHAVQAINKIIFEHEQKRQRQRASRADVTAKGRVEVEVQPISKPITFKASAKTEKLIKEPPGPSPSPRGLSAYLALPLDQYSLLDPDWISRSPQAPDVFVLRIPLFDLVGLELQPQVTVRVSLDPRNNQVHFLADQFKVGDPRFDEDFKLDMRATLRNKPVPTLRPLRSIKRMWSRAGSGGGGNGEASGDPSGTAAGVQAAPATSDASAPAASQAAALDAPSTAQTISAREVVVVDAEVVGVEKVSEGRRGGATRRSRTGTVADDRLGPEMTLDVGLRPEGLTPGARDSSSGSGDSASSAGGAPRPAPDLPPHVKVLSYNKPMGQSAATASAAATTSSSTTGRDAVPSYGSSLAATAAVRSEAPGGSGGSPTPPALRQGVGTSSSGSGATGNKNHVANGVVGTSPASSAVAPPSSSSASSSAPSYFSWPTGAYGPGHPAAAAVSTAAAQPSAPLDSSSSLSDPARQPAASDTLPFIEDEVLYVPANQWGRPSDGVAAGRQAGGSGREVGPTFKSAAAVPVVPRAGPRASLPAAPGSGSVASLKGASAEGVAAAAAVAVAASPRAAGAANGLHGGAREGAGAAGTAGRAQAVPDRSAAGGASSSGSDGSMGTNGRAAAALGSVAAASVTTVTGAAAPAGPPRRGGPAHPGSSLPGPSGTLPGRLPAAPNSAEGQGTYSGVAPAVAAPGMSTGAAASDATSRAAAGGSTSAAPAAASTPASASTSSDPLTGYAAANEQYRRNGGSRASAEPAQPAGSGADRTAADVEPVDAAPARSYLPVAQASGGAGASEVAEEGPAAMLVGNVDVAVTVMVPPALAAVPRPLLGMTGSLIARYAISSLLPSFLDLLAADYGRWSSGQTVSARAAPVGDLAATAAANAAAMGSPPNRTAAQQMAASMSTGSQTSSSNGDDRRAKE